MATDAAVRFAEGASTLYHGRKRSFLGGCWYLIGRQPVSNQKWKMATLVGDGQ